MKRIGIKLVALLALVLSCGAHAQGYMGVSAGLMDVDVGGDNPINAGIRGGYTWPGGFGVEGEATTSLVDGEVSSVDYSITTAAAYGTYRSPGSTYFKARAGLLHEDVDAGFVDGSDTGLSGGIGVGFQRSNFRFELEYTLVEADVNYFSGAFVFDF